MLSRHCEVVLGSILICALYLRGNEMVRRDVLLPRVPAKGMVNQTPTAKRGGPHAARAAAYSKRGRSTREGGISFCFCVCDVYSPFGWYQQGYLLLTNEANLGGVYT